MPSTGPIPSVTANQLTQALGEAVIRIRSLNRWLAASALRKNCARRIIRTEVVRPVDGEALRQPDARTIDPALDRSNRAIANGSGLLIGEARGSDQNQRFPLIRR